MCETALNLEDVIQNKHNKWPDTTCTGQFAKCSKQMNIYRKQTDTEQLNAYKTTRETKYPSWSVSIWNKKIKPQDKGQGI